jgi:hypothetical protein
MFQNRMLRILDWGEEISVEWTKLYNEDLHSF